MPGLKKIFLSFIPILLWHPLNIIIALFIAWLFWLAVPEANNPIISIHEYEFVGAFVSFMFAYVMIVHRRNSFKKLQDEMLINIDSNPVTLKRIFVISDIHLGHPKYHSEKERGELLEDFLDEKIKNMGPETGLIINGDFLDFQQSKVENLLSDFDNILEKLFEIINKGVKVWYIIGNHDIKLQNFKLKGRNLNIQYPQLRVRINVGGRIVHIEHGHLSDKWFSWFTDIYILGTILLGYVMFFIPGAGDALGSLVSRKHSIKYKHSITPRHEKYTKKKGNLDEYEKDAKKLLDGNLKPKRYQRQFRISSQEPCHIAVFGHTHKPYVKRFENGTFYVNSGDCIENTTFVEITSDKIYLGDWLGSNKEPKEERRDSYQLTDLSIKKVPTLTPKSE